MNCKCCAQPIIGEEWRVEDIDGTHIYCGDCSTPYAIQRMVKANKVCGFDPFISGVGPCVRRVEAVITMPDGTTQGRCVHHTRKRAAIEAV